MFCGVNMAWEEIANGPMIWLSGFLLAGVASFGAYLMYRKAAETSLKMGWSKERIREAMIASAITAIGPALGMAVGMVALIIVLTPGIAWLRESAGIGSIMYELITATFGATAVGKELGPGLTNADFVVVLAAMSVPCVAWLFGIAIATPGIMKVREKMLKVDPKIWGLLAIVMMLVAFGNFWAQYLVKGGASLLSGVIAYVIAAFIFEVADKIKKPRLKEYAFTISILIAIFLAEWIWVMFVGG